MIEVTNEQLIIFLVLFVDFIIKLAMCTGEHRYYKGELKTQNEVGIRIANWIVPFTYLILVVIFILSKISKQWKWYKSLPPK